MMLASFGTWLQWLGDRIQAMALWVVEHLGAWLQAAFAALRTFGDAELSSIIATAHAAFPSTTASLSYASIPKINAVFPLSETVTLATAYGTAWAAILTYRVVKSWIPTVAS